MKHKIWGFYGYTHLDENKAYQGVVKIHIDRAIDEADALEKAKKTITRPLYFLFEVYDCHTCALKELTKKEDDEIKKETLKFIKSHNKEHEEE